MHRIGIVLAVTLLGAAPRGQKSDEAPGSDLPATRTIECDGSGDFEVVGRSIATPGNAITVSGNCDVIVQGSHIIAGGIAIVTSGNGDVRIESSFVQGAKGAVLASGNGEVEYDGSTFRGGLVREGRAELIEESGVTAEAIPSGGRAVKSRESVTCGDKEKLTLTGVLIETDGVGITVGNGCELLLSDSYIVGGGAAVEVAAKGSLRVRNSTLEARRALLVAPGGYAHVAGTNLRGGVDGQIADGGGNAQ